MINIPLSRRNFIKLGAFATSSLLLEDVSFAQSDSEKSVILIWLGGGISDIEFTNPIPDAPVEFRSMLGHVQTNVPGLMLGGTFTNLAKVTNQLTIVRSFCHNHSSHEHATHGLMTGHLLTGNDVTIQQEPSIGSMVSNVCGVTNHKTGLPNYIRAGSTIQYDNAAWLGASYNPYSSQGGTENLALKVVQDRLFDRKHLLQSLDKARMDADNTNKMLSWEKFRHQTYDLILGQAKEAFDISKEPEIVRAKYGASALGKELLLARRLVQAGTKFVTLHHGGWDHHSSLIQEFPKRGLEIDAAIAALIDDLNQSGQSKNTLVVIASEFSRTPRINSGNPAAADPAPGRDHWGATSTLVFAGGHYNHGRIIGETNNKAEYVKSAPFGLQDLVYTIFDHLGMDKKLTRIDNAGRPKYFVDSNAKNILA